MIYLAKCCAFMYSYIPSPSPLLQAVVLLFSLLEIMLQISSHSINSAKEEDIIQNVVDRLKMEITEK